MKYKGYEILYTEGDHVYYTTNERGIPQEKVSRDIGSQAMGSDYWFSVVKDGWVESSHDTIEECKQWIDEETE